jgi:hypothetical protein
MAPIDDDLAALGAPPRRARLRRRFAVLRWILLLAAVAPGSCVYTLGRVEVAQLEQLARDGVVAEGHVADKRVTQGRGTTYRIAVEFAANGATWRTTDSVPQERFEATAIGARLDVTYLPSAPATNRIDRVDAARVARSHAAFAAGALALVAAFGFAAWMFERQARRALRLLRHGTAARATIGGAPAKRRAGTAVVSYAFRDGDGVEHTSRSGFRQADAVGLAPGSTAVVLFDADRPRRSALLASLLQLATLEPPPGCSAR